MALLVFPLPRSTRRIIARAIKRLNLGPRIRFLTQWITLMLLAALVESVTTLRRLQAREEKPTPRNIAVVDPRATYMETSMEKQRKFRAERNLYLAGFSLTLLFVIARLVELMQESVKFEEECTLHKKRLDDLADVANTTTLSSASGTNSTLRQRPTATRIG